jgi:hypothetical protein
VPLLVAFAAFLVTLTGARIYRFRGGAWVPGWTGGIGLLALFLVFMVAMLALGNPAWLEPLFFLVVGAVIGAYLSLARPALLGAWWQIWR